jgi:hypothetical protein
MNWSAHRWRPRERAGLARSAARSEAARALHRAPNGHEQALRWGASRAEVPLLKVLKRPYVLLLGSSAKHKNVDVILEQA